MTKPGTAQLRAIEHSGFGFLSSFVIRHSTTYANEVLGPNASEKRKVFALVLLVVSLILFSTEGAATPDSRNGPASVTGSSGSPTVTEGIASYYGREHHGKRTANGEIFNMHNLTAAHPSLAFGSQVKVTNLSNNRSVIVRINDRGPYCRGRMIDLSQGAAEHLEMIEVGIVRVKMEVLVAARSPAKRVFSPGEPVPNADLAAIR